MDDQQWNWFLTPSSTPTDATFTPASQQTPRTSTHFQDAFSPYAYQQATQASPQPALGFSAHDIYGQDNMHTSFQSNPSFEQSDQQFQHSFSSFDMTGQPNQGTKLAQDPTFHNFTDFFQIQTPPPTRDQSSRRKGQRPHSVVFGTPSAIDSRQQAASPRPLLDTTLHQRLSSSVSQPHLSQTAAVSSSIDPTTMACNDIFWNPPAPLLQATQTPTQSNAHFQGHSQASSQQSQTWNTLDDPFTFQPHLSPNTAPRSQPQQATLPSQSQPQLQPSINLSLHNQTSSRPSSTHGLPAVSQVQLVPNMMTTAAGVNPNLLYSSPNRFMSSSFDLNFSPENQMQSRSNLPSPDKASQMPFSQTNVARPCSQQQNLSADQIIRPDSAGRPGMRRSNTTGTARPMSLYGSLDSLSRSNTTTGIQRRASPLKRVNRNSMASLASISEAPKTLPRSRTSVVLTVDSKGRARAETRVIDPSPSKAMRSKYPNLWDESDEDSDSDQSTRFPVRNDSFSASRTSERHNKVARLDPPVENLEGLNLPRSNSSASMRQTPSKAAYAAAIQLRRQGSAKKPTFTGSHSRRSTVTSFNRSCTDLSEFEDSKNRDMAQDDAGAALRKVMEGRSQNDSVSAARQSRSKLQSHSSVPSLAFPPRTSSLVRSSTTTNFAIDSAPMHNNSPTKSSPMKPTGELANAISAVTRCVCNFPFTDDQLMIQCNSCQLWSHTGCLGMNPMQLPHSYTCCFCQNNHVQTAGRLSWETAAV